MSPRLPFSSAGSRSSAAAVHVRGAYRVSVESAARTTMRASRFEPGTSTSVPIDFSGPAPTRVHSSVSARGSSSSPRKIAARVERPHGSTSVRTSRTISVAA
jgi:hypothetical protein